MLRRLLLVVLLTITGAYAYAQSVPNSGTPITTNAVWTAAQWIAAWETKQDYGGDVSASSVTSSGLTKTLANWMAALIHSELGFSITTGGAKCDGTTDDTTAINNYLTTVPQGSLVYLPPGQQCVINSANLNVPSMIIEGLSSPTGLIANATGSSGFLVNPTYTIKLASGAQLKSLSVLRTGMTTNPTDSQEVTAVAQWGSEESRAITIAGSGVRIENLFIAGFNTAIYDSSWGNFIISDVLGDTYNGVFISGAGDNSSIVDTRFEPFTCLQSSNCDSTTTAWNRPGVAFYFQGKNGNTTGWYCTRCFSFMYMMGAVIDNVGAGYLNQGGYEWQSALDPGGTVAGTFGVRYTGTSAGVLTDSTYAGGQSIGFQNENFNYIDFGHIAMSSGAVAGMYLAGASGTQNTQTLTGPISAGNTATVTINGTATTYTALAGDGVNDVLLNLDRMINSNATLAAAYTSASWAGSTLTIRAPLATSLTVTTAHTGSMSWAASTASATLGAWGQLHGYTFAGLSSATSILVDAHDSLGFIIDGIPISNTGGPTGVLSIDATSTLLQIFNLPMAPITSLTGCGSGSPSIAAGSTPRRGTITEGTSATGCVVNYPNNLPYAPNCVVSSPTGSALPTSYSTSVSALTIVNGAASGNQYTYVCSP